MTRVISARTGMSGVGLVNHVSQTKTMTIFFIVFFETDLGGKNLRKSLKIMR